MKLSLLLTSLLGFAAISQYAVQADSLQDQINAATKKFCGGIAVSAPSKGETFTDPKKITVTVTRTPNAEAKVINGVDAYSIDSKGKAEYLSTVWKGSYKLDKKATLTVDLTKAKVKFPGQFEFRVWVHNTAGPDCTLMSKVFKAKSSSSHSNSAEEEEYEALNEDIDRGCFGIELTSPALGGSVPVDQTFSVEIKRDSAAHTDTLELLTLFSVNLDTRVSTKVKDSWTGHETITNIFNVKDTIPSSAKANNTAFYYELTATTQHGETCNFFSHPFYSN